MAKENLELILHDQYNVQRRINGLMSENTISLAGVIQNQKILKEILRDMQKYIVILAEEMKQAD